MPDTPDYSYYRVRAVEKALSILGLFTLDEPDLRVVDMAAKLKTNKSTIHRMVLTLERAGYLRRNPASGSYSLGLKIVELGAVAVSNLEVRHQARPHLERLQAATGQTIHMAVLDGPDIVYIEKLEGKAGVRLYSSVGRRAPVHCTALGKVLLAYQPRDVARDLLVARPLRPYTRRTTIDLAEILAHLEVVRQRGYAIDIQEHQELVHCAAAPVFDHTGSVIAAVSMTLIGSEFREDELHQSGRKVAETAAAISRDMGYDQESGAKSRPAVRGD
ncbi:MAG: IclR family transcriptional regulator [Bacillota bacterium]|nr:MAG: IclR family transcriptional regulator [Bacillota bacterium]